MSPTHIVLAISLAANAVLGYAYLGQRDTATVAKVEQRQAVGVAQECSKGTDQLVQQAGQREKEAGPKRQAAADKDRQHQAKAQQIMSTPSAVPGNACASAQQRIHGWWTERVKP